MNRGPTLDRYECTQCGDIKEVTKGEAPPQGNCGKTLRWGHRYEFIDNVALYDAIEEAVRDTKRFLKE